VTEHLERIVVALIAVLLVPAAAVAQPGDSRVDVEPVRCWWRTDAGDVRIGEPLTVLLTCAVLETSAARAIVDASRLEPAVVQLQPFDVLGGRRAKDLVTATRRFIQFEYTLRVIGEVFGGEATVPSLQLTYRIQSRAGEAGIETAGGEVVQGRDLTYAMPTLPVRVISTVPESATDIREAPVATFQQIERASFRSTVFRVLAGTLFGVAVLLAVSALLPAVRRRRQTAATDALFLADAVILSAARRELTEALEHARVAGWSDDTMGRVLAGLRIAAAYAANQPVSRTRAANGTAPNDGQLLVQTRTGAALVSATATAATLDGRTDLGELREALERFTAARYGRNADQRSSGLAESLDRAIHAIGRLVGGYSWHARRAAAIRKSVTGARERLWAR
jgi:hypothetical protein